MLLNINGKVIIPVGYDYIGKFGDNDLIPVSIYGKFSFVDLKGKTRLQLKNEYYRVGEFIDCVIKDKSKADAEWIDRYWKS